MTLLLLLIFLAFKSDHIFSSPSLPLARADIITSHGKVPLTLEIAKTPEELKNGLMHRRHLNPNHGMLFIFPTPRKVIFWMKNTFIPLDLIFLDRTKKVQEIYRNAQPHSLERIQSQDDSVQYAIEVEAGFAQKNRICIGDIFELSPKPIGLIRKKEEKIIASEGFLDIENMILQQVKK